MIKIILNILNILNTNQFEKELKKLNKVGIKVRVLNEKDIKAMKSVKENYMN